MNLCRDPPTQKNVTTLVMTVTGQGGIPVYYYVCLLVVCSLFKFDCHSWFLLIRVAKGCLYRRSPLTLHTIHLTNLPWVSKPRGLEPMGANNGQFHHQNLMGFCQVNHSDLHFDVSCFFKVLCEHVVCTFASIEFTDNDVKIRMAPFTIDWN